VLVVDDVALLRRMVMRQLSELGYRAFEAGDLAGAMQVLEAEAIDVLLTDIVIGPGGNGFDLARGAMERWPALRVLFTSGFTNEHILADRGFAGMPILPKPFRREELVKALRDLIGAPA
jgi:CheY-like chemotaxis protein